MEKYELFGIDENASLTAKINSIVQALNQLGRISNDVVQDWQKVMEWAMGEGLDEATNKEIESLIAGGRFEEMISLALTEFNVRVDSVETSLNGKAKKHWIDVKDNGVKGDGITIDSTVIQSLINANDNRTLYFPNGVYLINQPLSITNNVCLLLDSEAEIRATVPMTSLLTYNISYTQPIKRFIKGGIWNGNGFANICLNLIGFAGLTASNMIIKNPLVKGLYAGSDGITGGTSFELYAHDMAFINTLSFSVNPSVIGIHMNTSDSNFNTISMKDFTTGMQMTQGGNNIENFHPWISQSERFPTSIGVNNQASTNFYNNCYFDTLMVGFQSDHASNLINCIFRITPSYRSYATSNPNFINATLTTGTIILDGCYLEYTGTSGNVDVVIGQTANVKFANSYIGTPNTNVTSKPMFANTRIRINAYALQPVPANSYKTYTFTITDTNITFGLGDTVIFNTRDTFENGLIPHYAVSNTNVVKMKLYNVTGTQIQPADKVVYASVIPNVNDINPSSMTITTT